MACRILVGREVWRAIKRLNRGRRSPATIVTAFFGTGGADILPLRSGDRVFVGATEANVRAGLVNPQELLRYPRGVSVFAVAALHAKMYSFGGRAIIGSANVSASACDHLLEIGIQVALTAAERNAAIDQIERRLLTRADLASLADHYRPPQGAFEQLVDPSTRRPSKRATTAPSTSARIWYHGTFSEDLVHSNPLVIELPTLRRLHVGDWYVMVYRNASGRQLASAPRHVSKVRVKGAKVHVWFRRRRETIEGVPVREIERLVEPGKPPVKYRWQRVSDRIPAAQIFRRFGLSVSQ